MLRYIELNSHKEEREPYQMNEVFPICHLEDRKIDGFDLIRVLGLIKEYNWKEIWRRYQPQDQQSDTISMYVVAERYFMEMHVQKMHRIILSEKFNTNPFFMQQVIQRIIASHDHNLILEKIKKQGIDAGDNPISLACSMGNTIVDFVANKNDPFPQLNHKKFGPTCVETTKKDPLTSTTVLHSISLPAKSDQRNLQTLRFEVSKRGLQARK